MTDRHRVVAAVLVYRFDNYKTRFLIMKRPPTAEFYPNIWVAPGGGVELSDFDGEPSTTVERAALRELQEEVGPMKVGNVRYLCTRGFVRPDGVGVIVVTHTACWVEDDPILTPEAVEFAWVTATEASTYDLIGTTYLEICEATQMFEPF